MCFPAPGPSRRDCLWRAPSLSRCRDMKVLHGCLVELNCGSRGPVGPVLSQRGRLELLESAFQLLEPLDDRPGKGETQFAGLRGWHQGHGACLDLGLRGRRRAGVCSSPTRDSMGVSRPPLRTPSLLLVAGAPNVLTRGAAGRLAVRRDRERRCRRGPCLRSTPSKMVARAGMRSRRSVRS